MGKNGMVKAVHRTHKDSTENPYLKYFDLETAEKARNFHKTFPEYKETPLRELKGLSDILGVSGIYVKDESRRFGLNAFKALGGSYCLGNYIAQVLGTDIKDLSLTKIRSRNVQEKLGSLTFVTATDGNHGRGIAWTASKMKQKSVVYMPKGSSRERLRNIQEVNGEAFITELNYDDTVRFAGKMAQEKGWILVQDTAWEGYETIPLWIMQGYTTMAAEAIGQMDTEIPTHIFLQAGVGAMAGALTGFFENLYGKEEKRPKIVIVEANQADCIYRTAAAADGNLHTVKGDLSTIMAGLACGEPCTVGWEILKDYADDFVSVPDWIAAKGMRVLGNPPRQDKKVISGESGAVTLGLVTEILQNPQLYWLKEQLGLDQTSRILCFSTEGDTDSFNYRRIVWDGQYSRF